MFDPQYEAQMRLLLRCLPDISQHRCFAIKGGTAINLFLQDLPRVSVDIDLVYLPLKPRTESLQEIQRILPNKLLSALDEGERQFLISMKRGEPEWERLGIGHLEDLPALKWKLINIRRMDSERHKEALERLVKILK